MDTASTSGQKGSHTTTANFPGADVKVDSLSKGSIYSYTFDQIEADHTIHATFAAETFSITATAGTTGSITPACGYIWVPSGNGNLTSPPENAGSAEYHFKVPDTGDYVIWGRQLSNDTTSDSFFVSVDGQAEMVWHTKLGGKDVWTWDVVSMRTPDDPRDPDSPERYRLAAGPHTLKIKPREDGTKLDRILITNQVGLTRPEQDSVIDAMEFGDVQVNHNWTRVNFNKPFVNPMVVAGPISLNGGAPVVIGDITYLVERTADAVKRQKYNLLFETPFSTSPAFLADMQTIDGKDTANIR